MTILHNTTLGKIKKKFVTLLLFFPLTLFSSCDILTGVLGDYAATGTLTNEEIVAGLKAALKEGARFAANSASQSNGYLNNPVVDIRILMPDELRKVEKNIRKIPLVGDDIVDDFVEAMNRGAEKAAREAAPVFVDAITSMSISDAAGILKGSNSAASDYLKRTTSQKLEDRFKPIIRNALNEVGAIKYYDALKNGIDTYNKAPLVQDINVNLRTLPELETYATEKALEGLFRLVSVEEQKIRENPYAYSEQIIKKVFGSIKKQPGFGY